MRPTALFAGYLALALILGALLAYPVYLWLYPAIDEPMYRFVTRSGMLIALLGLPWFLRHQNLADRRALGYAPPWPSLVRDVIMGLIIGVCIMLPLIGGLIALDIRIPDPDWVFSGANLALALLEGLLAGLLVAPIEETFFRGAMFTAVARHSGLWPAALLTSLLYAALHFLTTDYDVPAGALEWYSGLVSLGYMFEQYTQPAALVDSFLALIAVGMFLALVRARTGHIATCIGLHAGWVMTIKLTKDVTVTNESARFSFLAGDYDGVIGYLALALIATLAIVYAVMTRDRPQSPDAALKQVDRSAQSRAQ
ncbi:MAG: lysostaphin resistance A-like protein [Gammaproteobacteria bacterium]